MKILFIDPLYTYLSTRSVGRGDYRGVHISLGLRYINSYLRRGLPGVEVRVINDNIEKTIDEFKPNVVGITSFSPTYPLASYYARICKQRQIPVIIGGVHITAAPLSMTKDMDFGVLGEGEETMLEIVRTLMNSNFDLDKVKTLDGLAFRDENGQIKFTKPRKLIESLDSIPFPERDPASKHHSGEIIITTRGCLYQCKYCTSHKMWPKIRFRSAENIVSEMEYLIRTLNVPNIIFDDEMFGANRKILRELVSLVEKKGINKKLQFTAPFRANLIDEEMIKLLKRMNFVGVGMGLESGCQKTLDYLKSGPANVDQYYKAMESLEKAGIKISAAFIIGSPAETREDILETLNFIKKSKITNFYVWPLTPLPGTQIWDYAQQRGLVDDDMDWERLDVMNSPNLKRKDLEKFIILSETLSRDELWELFKMFYKEKRLIKFRDYFISFPQKIRYGLRHPSYLLPYVRYRIDSFLYGHWGKRI